MTHTTTSRAQIMRAALAASPHKDVLDYKSECIVLRQQIALLRKRIAELEARLHEREAKP